MRRLTLTDTGPSFLEASPVRYRNIRRILHDVQTELGPPRTNQEQSGGEDTPSSDANQTSSDESESLLPSSVDQPPEGSKGSREGDEGEDSSS